jgi:hypothetical protein
VVIADPALGDMDRLVEADSLAQRVVAGGLGRSAGDRVPIERVAERAARALADGEDLVVSNGVDVLVDFGRTYAVQIPEMMHPGVPS